MTLERRGWLLAAGVAAAATAAGVGWSLWRQRGAGVADELWVSTFDTPDGQRLTLEGDLAAGGGVDVAD